MSDELPGALSWKDDAQDRIASAIAEAVDGPCLVNHFVLIVDLTTDDGDRGIMFEINSDDRHADSLGLLAWGEKLVDHLVHDAFSAED